MVQGRRRRSPAHWLRPARRQGDAGPKCQELPITGGQRSNAPRGAIAGQPRVIESRHVSRASAVRRTLEHPCIASRPPLLGFDSRRTGSASRRGRTEANCPHHTGADGEQRAFRRDQNIRNRRGPCGWHGPRQNFWVIGGGTRPITFVFISPWRIIVA
jgi:hypothetical protein